MVRPDRDRIGGPGVSVEMDCTFIGGRAGKGRTRYENKAEVAVAIELRHPKGYGRVRLAHIDSATRKDHLIEFIERNILPGTILYTDGDTIYTTIPKRLGITHERIVLVASPKAAHESLPGVHRVASLLKRWLTGTLHDGQSANQLDYYLDEFTFRFNRRTSRSRGLLWYRLIQQALNTDPHPYNDIISRKATT
jgi:transposase-like protein